MLTYELEAALENEGYTAVCGVDEAGRGPLCGPVAAAACILPTGLVIEGLNDSKKLSEKKREQLFDEICEKAIAYCVVLGSVEEINETDILSTTLHAMRRAIDGLQVKADFALIDGNQTRGFTIPCRAVVHGDAVSPSIAAASILAKVTRDRLCLELDAAHPEYGISKHKGYGTKAHMDALRKYGPCEIYRTKFIRFLDKD
ncbi:MAG: ribonuclease HII [Clostridia bacterium]|nr:ribonuclease HII [Oscillospiraceae bacterium]MBQ2773172.1 ribonuclease HII [Clostridia bacterium]MBQ3056212.1 ribonuclease HII [Clostridia bacterium]